MAEDRFLAEAVSHDLMGDKEFFLPPISSNTALWITENYIWPIGLCLVDL
ncbi:hypothetical protein [Malonomonas rubra]|nr:hypothetical protein [Malonomonas rubra]